VEEVNQGYEDAGAWEFQDWQTETLVVH
jgi:hypothetical protein